MLSRSLNIVIALTALVVLPFFMEAIGLTVDSAIDVIVLATAALALNLLFGYTGLISFGNGLWFGIGVYAAALAHLHWFPDQMLLPALISIATVAVMATVLGFLILRRKGVYFSLLTLALTALGYAIAFRWTEVTGGENGLGGITRPAPFGLSTVNSDSYYVLAAIVVFAVFFGLQRFVRSPIGTVLVAIRENEERARFLGYATPSYKLICFVVSATVTALAGVLFLFHHRFASADPVSPAFSGELLAMVLIGGSRSFLGPALGALFYVLFREFLSQWTGDWLFYFGLLFVGFIMFSPSGLVGVAGRIIGPFLPKRTGAAAMANRSIAEGEPLPAFLRRKDADREPLLRVAGLAKNFGSVQAVRDASFIVRNRTLHALIGPNGAGKTSAFNLISGMFAPSRGKVTLGDESIAGLPPEAVCRRGLARSFQITNLFPTLSVEENLRLGVQATHASRFNPWIGAKGITAINQETAEIIRFLGVRGMETAEAGALSYGGQRVLDMGLAITSKPRMLLLDEPLAGLAAAERERIGRLIRQIADDIPVLLVEHDIDRVFDLADAVTVMNGGEVLVDGSAEEVRTDKRVQDIYIGSGVAALAARELVSAARPELLLGLKGIDTFYGKSQILSDVSLDVHHGEIVALLGRNGAGKTTLLKTLIGIAPPATGEATLAGENIAGLASAEIARRGVGYVPQGRGLFSGMSVRQNLELGRLRRLTGNGRHWTEERVLEFFPRLRERLDIDADRLSGGEQQMVAVARALVGDTRLLLLDEPFEGLSPAITEELFDAFDKLRSEVSILIVDHHLDLVLNLADRVTVLERGRVVHEGPARPLARDLDLRREVLWL
ncbi:MULTISPECIES: branched-chain amino acid ABC transporter ATP-binding protein/permease [unclassified Aurantimonas]|uniref:branched-chain amino acid ABC transporter ATP-binding protein/permease n=1 Tax=unclassified Aurantimonas TaxID=2638230 RepID=UPI002E19D472|nr:MULTISPECIES: branched-chain amino acid ABC transporter ATP-binding protein/permease [unclassified Aurantimonas]MEC5289493.1 branched-chain amino acid ABC transporter ATP-binding protein/permease [Aurantimonas sp. C2-3-R2]MEC5410574.1 branched-chain amino acid ABC transporter ATP-binding protein/permease [Aurantimonas sp. C2-4-R8]